jgi:molybdate transport system regulatory protein
VLSDDDALPLDSLLAAISRFSLQTSARNQWFGTITGRDHQQVQQHVEVLLADGRPAKSPSPRKARASGPG